MNTATVLSCMLISLKHILRVFIIAKSIILISCRDHKYLNKPLRYRGSQSTNPLPLFLCTRSSSSSQITSPIRLLLADEYFSSADMSTSLITLPDGSCRCIVCNDLFRCRTNARVHFERAHAAPEYYECCFCKRVVKSKYNFRVHVNMTHGVRGKNTLEQYGKIVSGPVTRLI